MGRNRPHLRSAPTAVYRIYSAFGDLLYVGISSRLIVRLTEHRRWSPWFRDAEFIGVEEYANQREARIAEALAIRDEAPQCNGRPEAINARAIASGDEPMPMDAYEIRVSDIWGDD